MTTDSCPCGVATVCNCDRALPTRHGEYTIVTALEWLERTRVRQRESAEAYRATPWWRFNRRAGLRAEHAFLSQQVVALKDVTFAQRYGAGPKRTEALTARLLGSSIRS